MRAVAVILAGIGLVGCATSRVPRDRSLAESFRDRLGPSTRLPVPIDPSIEAAMWRDLLNGWRHDPTLGPWIEQNFEMLSCYHGLTCIVLHHWPSNDLRADPSASRILARLIDGGSNWGTVPPGAFPPDLSVGEVAAGTLQLAYDRHDLHSTEGWLAWLGSRPNNYGGPE